MAEGPPRPAFTGERLPGEDPRFRADLARHLAAYHVARAYCGGKTVLDAGCGEGYGAALLAEGAARVVGVDRARDALAHARARYPRPNLTFEYADLEHLEAYAGRFDVVCNFQVVEHLVVPATLLEQLASCLVPGGRLILTTPNRVMTFSPNPYHVREYTAAELRALLAPHFSAVDVRGVAGNAKVADYEAARKRQVERLMRLDPLGLHRLLPAPVVQWAFGRLATLVRRRIADGAPAGGDIVPEDFREQPTADGALDLLALCTR